jgi:hypothetical protein
MKPEALRSHGADLMIMALGSIKTDPIQKWASIDKNFAGAATRL